jgi:hypothetical protein
MFSVIGSVDILLNCCRLCVRVVSADQRFGLLVICLSNPTVADHLRPTIADTICTAVGKAM